jgi:hypothetical protein
MTVYFDKENFLNYFKKLDGHEFGNDTLRMLKKQLNIHLNFEIEGLDDYDYTLIEEFQSGISENFSMTHGENKVNRPLTKESFPTYNDIYLLSDQNVDKLKKHHIIMLANIDEEIEILNKLIINVDYSFHNEKLIGKDITPKTHVDLLDFPFSTIVIIDRYVFKGPEAGGNISFYDYNLDKILRKIYSNKEGYSRLVFVYQVNVSVAKTSPKYDEGPDLDKLAQKIKKVTGKYCPAPEIFLIGVPVGTIDDEHDRYIVSNYLRIKSGDSIIYFDANDGIVTKSKTVDYYSLGFKQYRETNKNLLVKIKTIIEETLNKNSRYSKIPAGTKHNEVLNLL